MAIAGGDSWAAESTDRTIRAQLSWSSTDSTQTNLPAPSGTTAFLYVWLKNGVTQFKGGEIQLSWEGDTPPDCRTVTAVFPQTSTTCQYLNRGGNVPVTESTSSPLRYSWANLSINTSCAAGVVLKITIDFSGCTDGGATTFRLDSLTILNSASDKIHLSSENLGTPACANSCGLSCIVDAGIYFPHGNGVNDDTSALQTAIDSAAISPAACGTLRVPAGTYKIDEARGLVLRSNLHVVFQPGVVLTMNDSSRVAGSVLRGTGIHDVEITGGTIWGNRFLRARASDTVAVGIDLQGCTRVTCDGVTVRAMPRAGIQVSAGTSGLPSSSVTIRNCVVDSCRTHGIAIQALNAGEVRGCSTSRNVGTPWSAGLAVEAPGERRVHSLLLAQNSSHDDRTGIAVRGAGARDIVIEGSECLSDSSYGIDLGDSTVRVVVSGNIVSRSGLHGIWVHGHSSDNVLVSNEVEASSQLSHVRYDNIRVEGDADRNHIQRNQCRVGSVSTRPAWQINIASYDCERTYVVNNDLWRKWMYETGVFNDLGFGTVYTTSGGNRTSIRHFHAAPESTGAPGTVLSWELDEPSDMPAAFAVRRSLDGVAWTQVASPVLGFWMRDPEALPGARYALDAIQDDGTRSQVAETSAARENALTVMQPALLRVPARISYLAPALPGENSHVFQLSLWSASGRKVRLLAQGEATPGRHTVEWDGRDDRGGPVASGVYFVRYTYGTHRAALARVLVLTPGGQR